MLQTGIDAGHDLGPRRANRHWCAGCYFGWSFGWSFIGSGAEERAARV